MQRASSIPKMQTHGEDYNLNDPYAGQKEIQASAQYKFGERVEYLSSKEGWIRAKVIVVDDSRGIQVNVKNGYWLRGKELLERVRTLQDVPQARVASPSPRKISVHGEQGRINAVEVSANMWSFANKAQPQSPTNDGPVPEPAPEPSEPSRDSDERGGTGFDIKEALAKAELAARNAERAIQAAKEMRERFREEAEKSAHRIRSASPAIGTPRTQRSSSTESGSPLAGRQSSASRRAHSGSYPVKVGAGEIVAAAMHQARSGSNRPRVNSDHRPPASPLIGGRPPVAVTPQSTPRKVLASDSPSSKPRNLPLPRQSTPQRSSTPERSFVAQWTPRAQSSTGMQVKRSSSAPHGMRQAPPTPSMTPRRSSTPQRMEKGSPAPSDTPIGTPRRTLRELQPVRQSAKSNSPSNRCTQESSSQFVQPLDDAPRVKANVLSWLEGVLKPKPRSGDRQQPPRTLPGEGDSVAYSEIHFESAIGAGSFGTVWKGLCRGDVVAIKQCNVGDPKDAEMLVMEIGYLQKLRHPRLVSFLGCCKKPPHVLLLMEFMPGGSLYTLLFKTKVKLRLYEKLRMALQVSEGLVYLHDLSVVHRDLKTMNIVLDNDLNCKICDFGLTITLERTHMTVKALQGSPRYMAPEQFEANAKITEKVDIWQMGCMMLELFCLTIPFVKANHVQHIATELIVRKRPPAIPHEADPRARTLIHASLKIQPQMRPNAEGLVEALSFLCKHADEAMGRVSIV